MSKMQELVDTAIALSGGGLSLVGIGALLRYWVIPQIKAMGRDIANMKMLEVAMCTALEHDYPSLRGKAVGLLKEDD